MKRILKYSVFLAVLIGVLHAGEEEGSHQWVPYEKTYIDLNQVCFVDCGIFINFNDLWIRTEGILVDDYGFYINSVRLDDEKNLVWRCKNPKCGRPNEDYRVACKHCGTPR